MARYETGRAYDYGTFPASDMATRETLARAEYCRASDGYRVAGSVVHLDRVDAGLHVAGSAAIYRDAHFSVWYEFNGARCGRSFLIEEDGNAIEYFERLTRTVCPAITEYNGPTA